MTDEKKPTGLNIFAHLGGRLILDADPPGKPVDAAGELPDLSALGKLVYAPPEPQESNDEEVGTD